MTAALVILWLAVGAVLGIAGTRCLPLLQHSISVADHGLQERRRGRHARGLSRPHPLRVFERGGQRLERRRNRPPHRPGHAAVGQAPEQEAAA